MKNNRFKYFAVGCGAALILVILLVLAVIFIGIPYANRLAFQNLGGDATPNPFSLDITGTPGPTPTLLETHAPPAPVGTPIISDGGVSPDSVTVSSDYLSNIYETIGPGVVSVYVLINSGANSGQVAGSGFVFDQSGHVVTNNHVVEKAGVVVVIFQDGTESMAKVVGTDPYSDLAVLKVDQLPASARPLPLGDSDTVVPGDWVVAIGNPFGLNNSMTLGIVSAIGRTIPSLNASFSIPSAIQTDAAINPGNSGGPLLNLQGEIVGVNAQIASQGTDANAGVGFSIPSNIVRQVIPTLIEVGAYQWPWIGIEGTSVNIFIAQANHLKDDKGAYLVNIFPGGPAEKAGLIGGATTVTIDGLDVPTGGDVIIAADGHPINDYSDLLALVATYEPGTTIQLTILRNGTQKQIPVVLEPRPN
jgi:2-alkenal reductase